MPGLFGDWPEEPEREVTLFLVFEAGLVLGLVVLLATGFKWLLLGSLFALWGMAVRWAIRAWIGR